MMVRTMFKSKIHRATVTGANVQYIGSITIDAELLAAADLYEYEKVQVVDVDNGQRLETYVIAGAPGSGEVCFCLLYTSDAADERSSVDLGGRRIIKKKKERNEVDVRCEVLTTKEI